jgi:TolB protein
MTTATHRIWLLAAGFWLALSAPAQAMLRIEITEGAEGALPIAIVPFGLEGTSSAVREDVAGIVSADLARSGKFSPMTSERMTRLPHYANEIDFGAWRALGMENLVVGRINERSPGQYELQFQLFDVVRKQQLLGYSLPATPRTLRSAAHEISDLIYEKITGVPGAFNTRIVFVSVLGEPGPDRRYLLQVADTDGFNASTVLESSEPLMSPSWSPDGGSIAYVSFENRRPQVYVQELTTAKRRKVASFDGINGAPAWSPGGDRLALTLSKDGNPEIYILDLASKGLTRITDNRAIDTEPVWSANGKQLIFTSDRSGAPQLYEVGAGGGRAKRLTFEGSYNSRATLSPDGSLLAMVHGDGSGQYRIAVMDRSSGTLRVLTDGRLDESPSFAPNGSMILYASTEGNRGLLYAVSVDGRTKQRLTLTEGDVREPAWSPFRDKR